MDSGKGGVAKVAQHTENLQASGQWVLGTERADGQRTIQGITRGVLPPVQMRREVVWCPPAMLHPWQSEPPLPSLVTIHLSNHYPRSLPAPAGWDILQRNARALISTHGGGCSNCT